MEGRKNAGILGTAVMLAGFAGYEVHVNHENALGNSVRPVVEKIVGMPQPSEQAVNDANRTLTDLSKILSNDADTKDFSSAASLLEQSKSVYQKAQETLADNERFTTELNTLKNSRETVVWKLERNASIVVFGTGVSLTGIVGGMAVFEGINKRRISRKSANSTPVKN